MTEQAFRRQIASTFYRTYCPHRVEEIEFIDFNYPVRDVALPKGTRLSGFKDPRVSPLRCTFFTVPGTPISILGVHCMGNLKTNPKALARVRNEYEVLVTIPHVLESVCANGIDAWSLSKQLVPVAGGGWQYKIPHPERFVRYCTSFPNR